MEFFYFHFLRFHVRNFIEFSIEIFGFSRVLLTFIYGEIRNFTKGNLLFFTQEIHFFTHKKKILKRFESNLMISTAGKKNFSLFEPKKQKN